MKKLLVVILTLVLALGIAMPVSANGSVTDLTASGPDEGYNLDVGTVTVSNTGSDLVVTYLITDADWVITETHLHVVEGGESGIPQTGNGNPKVGKFAYKMDHGAGVSTYTYTIPLITTDHDWVADTLSIAAQAVVYGATVVDPDTLVAPRWESAWAEGDQLNDGRNWAMYFEYTVQ